jgi:selenocysteine lyase/cysteine desulfurase
LYGKYDLLNELKAYRVRPAGDELPYKFETGTQNHEGIAGVLGALEYLEWLGKEFGAEQESAWKDAGFSGRRLELKKGMSAMHAYEAELSRELIGIIESVPGTHIHGIADLNRLDERVPTVSFTLAGKRPEAVAEDIGKQHIYVWNGHNYALAIVERMGLLEAGGMIRVGPVHYNTKDELVKFGQVLEKVAK